jgi:peptidoglycan/LPS O-acetylase OafA/YrhL
MDLVRALAAAAVVWNHCFNMLLQPVSPANGAIYTLLARSASFGRDAVMIFFVISGFWIGRSVVTNVTRNRWSWSDYLINRLSRLYVVLIPALLLGFLFDGGGRFLLDVFPYRSLGFQGTHFYDVGTHLSPVIFLGNLAFLQDIAVPTWGSNGPLWTLALEFWYYLWFPAIYLLLRGRPNLSALIITILIASLAPVGLKLFGCWLLGVGVQWIDTKIGSTRFESGWRKTLAVTFGLIIWAGCTVLARRPGLDYFAGCYLISGGFAILLIILLRYNVGIPRLAWPIARFGADASFSLYAYHLPVLVALIAIFCGRQPWALDIAHVALAMVIGAVLIAGAWGFAWATEARTGQVRLFLKRLVARCQIPQTPAAHSIGDPPHG